MSNKQRVYIAIDLKSFYATVECIERGLDPMKTNLVVADNSRTDKTICLAVSPSLKSVGVPGRPRLFEVIQKVNIVNAQRRQKAKNKTFNGKSYNIDELNSDKNLELDYIVAIPRMAYYIEYSIKIYNVYLKYIAPEDIHVYSIDEVFMDVTDYLNTYDCTPHQLAKKILLDIKATTKATAVAGIGTNLYLAKIAMDILAKKTKPDEDDVCIAFLDEMEYRKQMWSHRPITDFWRVGSGYAKKLESRNMFTMGDIARCSLGKSNEYYNEDLLYKLFGVNAELLIDHAWGYEPCTIKDVCAYTPKVKSINSGQVLHVPYDFAKAKLVTMEMIEALSLDLVRKEVLTNQIVLTINYDRENLTNSYEADAYSGDIILDAYGREVPKHAHGTINIDEYTTSTKVLVKKSLELFDRIVDRKLSIRKINISANKLITNSDFEKLEKSKQLDMFDLLGGENSQSEAQSEVAKKKLDVEKNLQKVMLEIKQKHGENSILKSSSLLEGATAKARNEQIGGHKA